MRKLVFLMFCFLLQLGGGLSQAAEAPKGIASIHLGAAVTEFADKVDLTAAVPLWGSDYLMRAPLKPMKAFEGGYVVYGNCKEKGRIVRIKLKYENDGEDFYNDVMAALCKRYGKPNEWRGNPFGTLKIWKWSLKDARKRSVSIVLQHYEGDDDSFTPGNSIKLTESKYLEEEKACYESTQKSKKVEQRSKTSSETVDFDSYLPH